MAIRVVIPPGEEPVSLEQARLHLRIDAQGSPPTHPEDALVGWLITAAREAAEAFVGRPVAKATFELQTGAFGDRVQLPAGVVEVVELAYLDTEGAEQYLQPAAYRIFHGDQAVFLEPAYETAWPATRCVSGSVRVRFIAGWEPAEAPRAVVAAMLLTVGHLYVHREAVLPGGAASALPLGVQSLLQPHRVGLGV